MNRLWLLAGIVGFAVVTAANAQTGVAVVGKGPGVVGGANVVEVAATIKAINHKTREVTLVGSQGREIVVTAGPEVKNFAKMKVGDHVIPFLIPQCGKCAFCNSPKTNLCVEAFARLRPRESRFSLGGKPVTQLWGLGTFAEYTVLPVDTIAKVRDDAPFDPICYIGCGATTGLGAALFAAKIVGLSEQLLGNFEPLELDHAIEVERQLIVVHDLEQDDLVAIVAEPLEDGLKRLDLGEEVTEDHDDLAAA